MHITRVTANITRHETCEYELEGDLTEAEALALIESGNYDPDSSIIQHEDIDIVEFAVEDDFAAEESD